MRSAGKHFRLQSSGIAVFVRILTLEPWTMISAFIAALLTLSISVLSALPPPKKPDFSECDEWYSNGRVVGRGVDLSDCVAAWTELSEGSDPVVWRTRPQHSERYGLPLVRTVGE